MAAEAALSPDALTIRRATVRDAAVLARLNVDGWRGAYRGILSDAFLDAMSASEREKALRAFLPEAREVELWIAYRGDEAVGFITIGPARDLELDPREVGELYAIYVLQPHWDTGAGRALMEHATKRLKARRFQRATLWVLSENPRARRFYESAGWAVDGATKVEEVAGEMHQECRYQRELGTK